MNISNIRAIKVIITSLAGILMLLGASHEALAGTGNIFLNYSSPIEVSGSLLRLNGSYVLTSDDDKPSDLIPSSCQSPMVSSECYDGSQGIGELAQLHYKVDGNSKGAINTLLRGYNYFTGAWTDLGIMKSFSLGIDVTSLDPALWHEVEVYFQDIFGYRCQNCYWFGCGYSNFDIRGIGNEFASKKLKFRIKVDIPPDPPCTDPCGCRGSGGSSGSGGSGSGGFGSNSTEAPGNSTFNIITGRVSHQQELFSTKAAALATSLTLNYDSKYPLPGALGKGWSHSYDMSLNENSDGTMVLFGGGLSKRFYTKSISGYNPNSLDLSTLIKNSDGTYLVTKIDGTKYTFTAGKKISNITDRYSNTITIDNSVSGITTITDSAGHASILNYDTSDGKVISINDPAGNVYDLAYNTAGLLWKVTYPAPFNTETTRPYWEYLYNTAGLMEYKIDPDRHIVRYVYDSQGRVQESTDPNGVPDTSGNVIAQGHTKSLVYNPATGVTSFTEKDGGQWLYTFDPQTLVIKEKTAPDGTRNNFYYYPNLTLKASTRPFGSGKRLTTFYTYDDHGNLLTEAEPVDLSVYTNPSVDPASIDVATLANLTPPINWAFVYTYDYNNHDRIRSKTDLRGATPLVTRYDYDYATEPGVEIIRITDPETHVTTYRYNADGTLKSVIDANNVPITNTYENGLLASVTDQSRVVTKYTAYDNNGNPQQIQKLDRTGKLIATTDLTYDALNRLRTVTRTTTDTPPVITVAKYDYDQSGNLSSAIDPENKQTRYDYNYKGLITRIIDHDQQETRFTYSGAGCASCSSGVDKLTGVMDAKQLAMGWSGTSYYYDQLGRLERETDPRGKSIRYTYYDNGFLKQKLDTATTPETALITYEYNPRGQLTRKRHANGFTDSFEYDGNGRLWKAANPNISYTIDWYKNGWLKNISDSNGKTVSYEYDNAGNKSRMYGPDGIPYYFGYDQSNRPDWLYTPAGIYDLSYDSNGRLQNIRTGSYGTTGVSYSYDGLDRISNIQRTNYTGQVLASIGYSHDRSGNVLNRSDTVNNTLYEYDNLYRLKTVTANGAVTESYTYDAAGNRATGPATATSYSYSPGNQLDAKTGALYEYDDYGNLKLKTQGTTRYAYSYDNENRLIRVEKKSGTILVSEVTYSYDPFGRRTERNLLKNGVTTISRYVYDGDNILNEYDGSNQVLRRIINYPGRIDFPIAYNTGTSAYLYFRDNLGSVNFITDQNGAAIAEYSYDSFGVPQKTRTGSLPQPYSYTGREYDVETGLYYYRARYYDPQAGRFISRDPIGFAGGDVNLYGYVQNNPVNRIDPLGLASLVTDMRGGYTTFDPRPEDPNGEPLTIETRNAVDRRRSQPGAQDPYTTPDVTPRNNINTSAYGPPGAYIDTGDQRGRDIHGGGSSLPDPFSPRQGWRPTLGCTRGQNEDVQELNRRITDFKMRHPGVRVPYTRR